MPKIKVNRQKCLQLWFYTVYRVILGDKYTVANSYKYQRLMAPPPVIDNTYNCCHYRSCSKAMLC